MIFRRAKMLRIQGGNSEHLRSKPEEYASPWCDVPFHCLTTSVIFSSLKLMIRRERDGYFSPVSVPSCSINPFVFPFPLRKAKVFVESFLRPEIRISPPCRASLPGRQFFVAMASSRDYCVSRRTNNTRGREFRGDYAVSYPQRVV
jgi:hypothetical protein